MPNIHKKLLDSEYIIFCVLDLFKALKKLFKPKCTKEVEFLSLHLLQITAVGGFISIRVVAVCTSNRLIDDIVQI